MSGDINMGNELEHKPLTPQEIAQSLPLKIRVKAITIFDAQNLLHKSVDTPQSTELTPDKALASLQAELEHLYKDPDSLKDIDKLIQARADYLTSQSQNSHPDSSTKLREVIQNLQKENSSRLNRQVLDLQLEIGELTNNLSQLEKKPFLSKLVGFNKRSVIKGQIDYLKGHLAKLTATPTDRELTDREIIDRAVNNNLLRRYQNLNNENETEDRIETILEATNIDESTLSPEQMQVLEPVFDGIGAEKILTILKEAQQVSKFSPQEKEYLNDYYQDILDSLNSNWVRKGIRNLLTQEGAQAWLTLRSMQNFSNSEYVANIDKLIPLDVVERVARTGIIDYKSLFRLALNLDKVEGYLNRKLKYILAANYVTKGPFNQEFNIEAVQGIDDHIQWSKLSLERRKALLRSDLPDQERDKLASENSVSTEFLNEQYKLILLENVLKHVIEDSQNAGKKKTADQRNRQLLQDYPNPLIPGTLLHGSSAEYFQLILKGGLRSGYFLGPDSVKDSSPYGCDFAQVQGSQDRVSLKTRLELMGNSPTYQGLKRSSDFAKIYYQSISASYGAKSDIGRGNARDRKSLNNTGITLIFDRSSPEPFLKGTEYAGTMKDFGNQHKLILVGLPATEISGIIADQQTDLSTIKEQVVDNGFFIPIYDTQGNVIFSPQEFDNMTKSNST